MVANCEFPNTTNRASGLFSEAWGVGVAVGLGDGVGLPVGLGDGVAVGFGESEALLGVSGVVGFCVNATPKDNGPCRSVWGLNSS